MFMSSSRLILFSLLTDAASESCDKTFPGEIPASRKTITATSFRVVTK
jgi:hypothetical protein